jgi:endoglycosylceramidase
MARWIAVGLIVLALPLPASAAPVEPLGHAGRWITDAEGRVVNFHGEAIVPGNETTPPESVGIGADDAAFLAQHGFRLVRLGLFYRGYEEQPGVFDESYVDTFERTQQVLAAKGVFSVLDFHQDQLAPRYAGRGYPDWFLIDDGLPNTTNPFPQGYFFNPALNRAYDNLWANAPAPDGKGLQDHLAEGWRRVAARFAALDHVAGYDIFNEPWPGTAWPSCANPTGCPPGGFDQTQLTAFSNRVIAGVRAGDPRRLVFYEPNLQFDVGAATGHGKVDDPNAGMTFHNYCLGAAPGLPAVPDPVNACRDLGETLVFRNADAHSEATGAALLLSEFGDTKNADIHRRLADLADDFMVPWTSWAYAGSTGPLIEDPAKPPTGNNIRDATLRALVRAYPYVVAGTPRRIDWDLERKRLETTWSSTLPAGGPAGQAESELFVPDLHFGSTYHVDVRGAEAIGGLGTQELLLRGCPGVLEVAVTVADDPGPLPDTCSEQGGQANPRPPGGRRVRCPRGNSRSVRCFRTTLANGVGVLQVVGTRRHERLAGARGRDAIVCGAGNDRARGRAGPDTIRCGPGRDRIRAGDGPDRVFPGTGRDRVSCGRGRDRTRASRADVVGSSCERVAR